MLWLLMTAAFAAPCDAAAVAERLSPGSTAAGVRLDRAQDAATLLAVQTAAIIERCAESASEQRRIENVLESPAANHDLVQARTELFLLAGTPDTWRLDSRVDRTQYTWTVPKALAMTWAEHDGSAALDIAGIDRIRVQVRPGLSVPPPEEPKNAPRDWQPPAPPWVEVTRGETAVWTTSCWGPAWADELIGSICASLEPRVRTARITIAIPGTAWAITGPDHPDVCEYGTLRWPSLGITVRLNTYPTAEDAELHITEAPHAVTATSADGRQTAALMCTTEWPQSGSIADDICRSLVPADAASRQVLADLPHR
ncbi:MAG: hypothetical protein ACJAZO_004413 [Myxococcota bacterium]|jgi:hypothetical protein